MSSRTPIRSIFENKTLGENFTVKGWIRSVRKSKKFSFIVINDGTCQWNLQAIVDMDTPNYEQISSLLLGSAISMTGTLVESRGKQPVEMQAKSVEIISATDDTYPLQKKATSLEFLREQAHLRARTQTFGAVFRVRHALAMATHKFFSDKGFYYLNSPIISAVDGEGAGEMFKVSTMDLAKVPVKGGKADHTEDYFGKEVSLCVTGQLEGECYAMALGSIYTFGPTFRAENSNTTRHLSEFWMIEPEVAFADLEEVADLATDYIKYLIAYAQEHCPHELEFLATREGAPEGLLEMLTHVKESNFIRITYTEAVEILSKSGKTFEFPCTWGAELQTEHERFLTEEHFKLPVIVTDYPKEFKAFYMKQNDDGKTVRAMDVLVPGIGEIIGGSQREDNLEKLEARMDHDGMDKTGYWWYMDLRRYGSVPHAGFGLGFERAIMYITGMSNIRDVIPFPRTPKNCDF
tara:strand:+ start:35650 stop:37038 length:1389 start_codon:yes stop_codon:yes gene_type:complete